MNIKVDLAGHGYGIVLQRGALADAGEIFGLDRNVCILTDSGVPRQYAETVAGACRKAWIETVPAGEGSKSVECFHHVLSRLLAHGFTRFDCIVAVGGGVVGDLAGFVAASYMRGIDFYNIPTTVLSQVDSSVGGKTGLNLDGVKNIVGAFYQPKGVLIDPDVLKTLPARQISNGLAESVKMALTSDAALFSLFENAEILPNIDEIIYRSIDVKRRVVEADEKEQGLRRILNFGHTIGHGIESGGALKELYHGECVALGMLPMCGEAVRRRLEKVLKKLELPTSVDFDEEKVMDALMHDKKGFENGVRVTLVNAPGAYESAVCSFEELRERLRVLRREGS